MQKYEGISDSEDDLLEGGTSDDASVSDAPTSDSDSESAMTVDLSTDPEMPDFDDACVGWEHCSNKKCPKRVDGGGCTFQYNDVPPGDRWYLDYQWDNIELGKPTIDDTDFVKCVGRWLNDDWLNDVIKTRLLSIPGRGRGFIFQFKFQKIQANIFIPSPRMCINQVLHFHNM